MKADAVLLWLLVALLLVAMILTVRFAPRRSLHGYGERTLPGADAVAGPSPGEGSPPT